MPGLDASVASLVLRGMHFLLDVRPEYQGEFNIQLRGQDENVPLDDQCRLVFLLPDTKPFRRYAQVHRDLDSFLEENAEIFGERRLLDIHLVAPEVYFHDFPAMTDDRISRRWLLRAQYMEKRPLEFSLTCGLFPQGP